MQRCFSSLGCPELTLDEMFALATRHGLAALELRAVGGTVDVPGWLRSTHGSPEQAAAHWRSRGTSIRLAAFNTSLHLVGGTPAERDQLLAFVPWAEALGVRWLRVFDGGRLADAPEIAAATETLHWWRAERRRCGWRVDLMIETHDSLWTAAAIGRLLAAVPDAAILWDSHHTWRKGGEDPVATWQAIRRSVVHVHVKDSVDRPSERHPFTYVLPGDGRFPISPLLAALRADGFAGPVSLEWERMWHPYLPPLEVALTTAAARKWW
ncbi:MAG: sugar phosphate isomerase/epimerase [Verrucomicrobia bacterium]|nr:sugar phosphate isomerase/epimerase [Verrucomicrobiota bacterium]